MSKGMAKIDLGLEDLDRKKGALHLQYIKYE